ncbi:transcription initiation factor TFIID subunit 13 [Naviculisporaceae sp. PSN 640]
MEPRARAGKNVGKMNFSSLERTSTPLYRFPSHSPQPSYTVSGLLYGHGDVIRPLPETIRVLDEIATDFVQGISFDAARAAHHAGRQKVKFEDFEFAMRRNAGYMGKIQEIFEKKKEIESARKGFSIEDQIAKEEKNAEKNAERAAERAAEREEKRREKEKEKEREREAKAGGAGRKRRAEEISKDDDPPKDAEGEGEADADGEKDEENLFGDDGDMDPGALTQFLEDELLGEGGEDLNIDDYIRKV